MTAEMNPHAPIRPVREGWAGEQAFARLWEQRMRARGRWDEEDGRRIHPLQDVLDCRPRLRRARVAASFVTWLGTNMGLCFLDECRRATKSVTVPSLRAAEYIAVWAKTNMRRHGVNSGFRAIEHILAPAPIGDSILYGFRFNPAPCPRLSADDYETVENIVRWLATPAGQKFLDAAEATARELQDIQRDVDRAVASFR